MKINIYGYGFVGKAHYELLKDLYDVNIIDPVYPDMVKKDFTAEAAIICVGTPAHDNGSCNINNVYEVIESIDKTVPILIKSTISLEGWECIKDAFPKHSINFSPEFLRENNYKEDLQNMSVMYLSEERATWWAKLFNPLFKNLQFIVGRTEELITIKYFRNSFLATKVSFFNQVYDFCKQAGIEYNEVMNGIAQDTRIGFSHTKVTKERGWGGHCLPKDVNALLKTAEKLGVDLSILKTSVNYNNLVRKKTK